MEITKFEQMLELVAQAYDCAPEVIFGKLKLALEDGQRSTDPQVHALWESIPRTGPELTPEDFVEYLAKTLQTPFDA